MGDRVEWRRFADTNTPFQTIGVHITNDEDGDGTVEPMFTPDNAAKPTRILVKITGQSASPDLTTGTFIRYTVSSEVLLRRNSWS